MLQHSKDCQSTRRRHRHQHSCAHTYSCDSHTNVTQPRTSGAWSCDSHTNITQPHPCCTHSYHSHTDITQPPTSGAYSCDSHTNVTQPLTADHTLPHYHDGASVLFLPSRRTAERNRAGLLNTHTHTHTRTHTEKRRRTRTRTHTHTHTHTHTRLGGGGERVRTSTTDSQHSLTAATSRNLPGGGGASPNCGTASKSLLTVTDRY